MYTFHQGDSGGPLIAYEKVSAHGRIKKKAFLIGNTIVCSSLSESSMSRGGKRWGRVWPPRQARLLHQGDLVPALDRETCGGGAQV